MKMTCLKKRITAFYSSKGKLNQRVTILLAISCRFEVDYPNKNIEVDKEVYKKL